MIYDCFYHVSIKNESVRCEMCFIKNELISVNKVEAGNETWILDWPVRYKFAEA